MFKRIKAYFSKPKQKAVVVPVKRKWSDLATEEQQVCIAATTATIFNTTIDTGIQHSIIHSFFIAYVKNEKKFPYEITEAQGDEVLALMYHQLMHCMLQVYVNNVIMNYGTNFYKTVFSNPKIDKEHKVKMNTGNILDYNLIFGIFDRLTVSTKMSKLFEITDKKAFNLERFNDLETHATRTFYLSTLMIYKRSITEHNLCLREFVEDLTDIFRLHADKRYLAAFYIIYIHFFINRFDRLFTSQNGSDEVVFINKHGICFEHFLALEIYRSFKHDVENNGLDITIVGTSFDNKDSDKLASFHTLIKTYAILFISECGILQETIDSKNQPELKDQEELADNVVSIASKKPAISEYRKQADEFKERFK